LPMLQWGRDQLVAEIRDPAVLHPQRSAGFNGAATNWSRKFRHNGLWCKPLHRASMGPRPIGRGNPARTRSRRTGSAAASMGPRPIGRGNAFKIRISIWIKFSFNGAATNWSRKCADNRRRLDALCIASMGPRPIGRGNLRPGSRLPVKDAASMGPRPIGRGNGTRASRPSVAASSFNGAATNWSRK